MCEKCKDTGWIEIEIDGVPYMKQCDCVRQKKIIENAKRSGLGYLLETYTFERFTTEYEFQKRLLSKAKTFCNETNNRWFAVLGKSGAGKSHICSAICKELLKKGYEVKFMCWLDDSRRLKTRLLDDGYENEVNEYKDAEVLYIDDLFKGEPSNADIKLANEIINYRYNKARSTRRRVLTIISTERLLGEMVKIDEAIAGRIVEMSEGYLTVLKDAINYRLKKFL